VAEVDTEVGIPQSITATLVRVLFRITRTSTPGTCLRCLHPRGWTGAVVVDEDVAMDTVVAAEVVGVVLHL
jgi:hypothetical protein